MAKIMQHQHLENKNLEKLLSDEQISPSIFLKLSVSNNRTLLRTLGTYLSHQRLLGLITQSAEEEGSTVLGYMLT
jgi:hypothetical protein